MVWSMVVMAVSIFFDCMSVSASESVRNICWPNGRGLSEGAMSNVSAGLHSS